ncbi:MAG: hypothetical protein V2A55_03385, partial [Candidatus Jorgensenbacteria bacterium]
MKKLNIIVLAGLIGLIGLIGLAGTAQAFVGPDAGQSPGAGGGKFILDSQGNIGFGTSSSTPKDNFDSTSTDNGYPANFGYVFMVASTTNPSVGLKNLTSGNVWLWSSRNFGSFQLFRESPTLPGLVVMEVDQYGNIGVSTRATSTTRFKVSGNVESTGSFVGSVSGAISAANVSSDVLGRLQGNGNFAFPASVGIATSSQSGLPQPLSVYGNTYLSGNVGIGTTAPTTAWSRTLQVYSSSNADLSVKTPAGEWHMVSDGNAGLFFTNTGSYTRRVYFQNNGDIGLGGTITSDTALTGASMVIKSGSVGIGTTSPDAKLDVRGGNVNISYSGEAPSQGSVLNLVRNYATAELLSLENTATQATTNYIDSSVATFKFDTGARTGFSRIRFFPTNITNGSLEGAITFRNRSSNSEQEAMRIQGLNVGIGDTTPTEGKLVVGGTGYFTGTVTVGTPTADAHAATKNYVDSTVGGGSTGVWLLSGSNLYASSTAWNVGIGTASPGAALHVVGNITSPGAGSQSEKFGKLSAAAGISSVAIGYNASASGNNAVAIGWGASANQNNSFAFGTQASVSGEQATAIGAQATAAFRGIALGYTATANNNQFVIGGGGAPITEMYIGEGASDASPQAVTISSTGGSGTDIAGANLTLAAGAGTGTGGGGNLYFKTAPAGTTGSTVNTLATRMTITPGGNVGIATTSPAYALHVYGTGAFSQPLIVGTPTADSHAATKNYVDSTVGGGSGAGSFATLTVSGTSTLATASGRVGIGTTNPGYDLHISKSTADLALQAPGTGTAERFWFVSGAGPGGGDGGGEIRVHTSGDLANSRAMIYMRRISTASGQNSVGDWPIAFWTSATDNAATEKLRILGNGNVGIGTTSPSSLLNVAGQIEATALLDHSYEGGKIDFGGASAAATTLDFYTGNNLSTAKVVIDANGNVGIATTSPAYALQVYGTGAFSQPLIVGTPTATSHATTKSYVDSISAGSSGVWLLSGSNLYASSTAWNVGIGTTGPTAKLHVLGVSTAPAVSGNATGDLILQSAGTFGLSLGTFDSGSQYGWIQSQYANSADVVRSLVLNPNGGNVGIGTASPTSLLHLRSDDPQLKLDDSGGGDVWILRNLAGAFHIRDATTLE